MLRYGWQAACSRPVARLRYRPGLTASVNAMTGAVAVSAFPAAGGVEELAGFCWVCVAGISPGQISAGLDDFKTGAQKICSGVGALTARQIGMLAPTRSTQAASARIIAVRRCGRAVEAAGESGSRFGVKLLGPRRGIHRMMQCRASARHRLQQREDRRIGSCRQFDPELILIAGLIVVLREFLADFADRHAHRGIGIGVVSRIALEDLDADVPLLERIGIAPERLLDDIAEQDLAARAGSEAGTGEKPTQLLFHGFRSGR